MKKKAALDRVEDAAQHVVDAVEEKAGDVLHALRKDKEVIVYPTYGYRKEDDEGTWVVRPASACAKSSYATWWAKETKRAPRASKA